jgi:N-acyl homoserine lactone hydrolase
MSLPDRLRWMMVAVDPGDIVRGVQLAAQNRLTCIDGDVADVLPNIDLHVAYDSHTFASMWVAVRNDGKADSSDTWVLAGDLVYVFENIQGPGAVVDLETTMYVPVGLAVGSQANLVMATEAMMKTTGYDSRRVIPIHEERLKDTFPSRIAKNGLRISEICLADGEASKVK